MDKGISTTNPSMRACRLLAPWADVGGDPQTIKLCFGIRHPKLLNDKGLCVVSLLPPFIRGPQAQLDRTAQARLRLDVVWYREFGNF